MGPDDPDTLTVRGNLARWRGESGDAAGAAAAFADLLSDRERVLGPDHPHTLTTRNNLAYWRGESGMLPELREPSPICWVTWCEYWAPTIPKP
ncbi:tetratricopeptide repeat protein [Streptomyces sp. S1D4-11]